MLEWKFLGQLVISPHNIIWIIILSSCTALGIYTNQIDGKLTINLESEKFEKAIVIVQLNEYSFANFNEENLVVRKNIVKLVGEEKRFSIKINDLVKEVVIYVFSENYKLASSYFKQGLFNKPTFNLEITLDYDNNWENNYYFSIKPAMIKYITSHDIPNYYKSVLHDWLLKVEPK